MVDIDDDSDDKDDGEAPRRLLVLPPVGVEVAVVRSKPLAVLAAAATAAAEASSAPREGRFR